MELQVTAEEEKRVKALGFLRNRGTNNFSGRVVTRNGKITAAQQQCIGEAAALFGNGNVTLTVRLSIEVQGIPYDKIEEFRSHIAKENLVTGGTGAKIRPITSCKGSTCKFGLCDTFAVSEEGHNRFYEGYKTVKLPHKFKIAVGGCPNNCMKPNLNDVGIVGQKSPNYDKVLCRGCKKCLVENTCPTSAAKVVDETLKMDDNICVNCGLCIGKCPFGAISSGTSGYQVCIGGRWGKKIAIGKPLNRMFRTQKEALDTVEKSILIYKEKGIRGERFSQTIERIGFLKIEAELLSDDIWNRKQTVLEQE